MNTYSCPNQPIVLVLDDIHPDGVKALTTWARDAEHRLGMACAAAIKELLVVRPT
jgi:hypothetical protein